MTNGSQFFLFRNCTFCINILSILHIFTDSDSPTCEFSEPVKKNSFGSQRTLGATLQVSYILPYYINGVYLDYHYLIFLYWYLQIKTDTLHLIHNKQQMTQNQWQATNDTQPMTQHIARVIFARNQLFALDSTPLLAPHKNYVFCSSLKPYILI